MMQHQNAGSTNQNNNSTTTAAQNKPNGHLNIDFDNVEDILDFSVRTSPTTSESKSPKQRPPQRHKKIADKPVKLFEIKPLIDNFVNNEEEFFEGDDEDDDTEDGSKRRFRCVYCGSKFVRSSHLRRHLYSHTGAKPYFCPICRKRFARSDYVSIHTQSHYKNKIHFCCICGRLYMDLEIYTQHCRSHADSEYMRIAMNNNAYDSEVSIFKQTQKAQDPLPAATCLKEIELLSCVKIETVDNTFNEDDIVYMENPIYLREHRGQEVSTSNDECILLDSASGSSNNSVSSSTSATNNVSFVSQ